MTRDVEEHHHPAPHRHRAPLGMLIFALVGGPAAWLFQLIGGFVLSATNCSSNAGARAALFILDLLCLALALAAASAGAHLFQKSKREVDGDHRHLLETGSGRTRFMATCAIWLGSGFALAIAANLLAIGMLMSCG